MGIVFLGLFVEFGSGDIGDKAEGAQPVGAKGRHALAALEVDGGQPLGAVHGERRAAHDLGERIGNPAQLRRKIRAVDFADGLAGGHFERVDDGFEVAPDGAHEAAGAELQFLVDAVETFAHGGGGVELKFLARGLDDRTEAVAHRGGGVDALLADDVGGRVLVLDHDDDDGALLVAAILVVGDDADERELPEFEPEREQPVIEQALLELVDVVVGDSGDEGGSLGTSRGDGHALQRVDRVKFPGVSAPELVLLGRDLLEVARFVEPARLDALALHQTVRRHKAADDGDPGLLPLEIGVEPLVQAGLIAGFELGRAIQHDGSVVGPRDARNQGPIGIDFYQQVAPGMAFK